MKKQNARSQGVRVLFVAEEKATELKIGVSVIDNNVKATSNGLDTKF